MVKLVDGGMVAEMNSEIAKLAQEVVSLQVRLRTLNNLAAIAISSFDNYGQHHGWCASRSEATCDCGYATLAEDLRAEQERLHVYIQPGIEPKNQ